MSPSPLSWGAQVAAHTAYIEEHAIAIEAPGPRSQSATGSRRRPAGALRNREALLHALRDGRPHRFVDLVAALPGMSRQGIYYLCDQLKAEGRIDWVVANRSNRIYRLT